MSSDEGDVASLAVMSASSSPFFDFLVGWNPGDDYAFVIVGEVCKNMLNV